jgi:thiol-disulfide isomerase/thioredoxin
MNRRLRHAAVAVFIGALPVLACGEVAMTPAARMPARVEATAQSEIARLMERYVDVRGRVDYASWHRSFEDVVALDTYLRDLRKHPPPESANEHHASSDGLAYWLNLYNALVLRNILARWPIDVVDARAFLHELHFEVGGREMSLNDIETKIIRATFADPRAHFAISCGAQSCPLLPRTPFEGVALDSRLDDATRTFVNRKSNVRVDDEARRIFLSPIFGWYEADFVRAMRARTQLPAPSVTDFVRMYAAPPLAAALKRAQRARYRVELLPYDWRVNDIASLPLSANPANPPTEEVAQVALPDIELELLDGTPLRTSDARGKVLVLDFWATWCRPCLWSFPRYAELLVAYEKRGLQIVAVAQDETRNPVDDFVRTNAVGVDIALDTHHLSAGPPFAVSTLPTVLVVDRSGIIRYRSEGYDSSGYLRLEKKVMELLDEAPP